MHEKGIYFIMIFTKQQQQFVAHNESYEKAEKKFR